MLVADPAPGSVPNRQLSVVNRQWLLLARARRDRLFQLGLVLIALVVISAILAPVLAPYDPLRGDLRGAYLRPPGGAYLLGTDTQGRDLLSRVIYGARVSLIVGLVSQTIATLLGVTMGLLSGFYGRWVDALVMRLADITLAFPTLLLLIAIAAAVNPSLLVVFIVIGAVGWAAMARLVRSQVLVLRGTDYVTAARALGAPDRRLLFRHLLPNVRAQVIVAATLGAAGAMMAEAALSFVGLGVKPPTPSWGSMVADGRDLLRVAPWVSVVPGLALGLTVLGFNLVGEALREIYDPKLRRGE
ncbi:MAG TPA: ABC transporter permease [Gemmatimonadales bacterium]|nr:ABC transporter permease [Gemmatimonadales bacterium]